MGAAAAVVVADPSVLARLARAAVERAGQAAVAAGAGQAVAAAAGAGPLQLVAPLRCG